MKILYFVLLEFIVEFIVGYQFPYYNNTIHDESNNKLDRYKRDQPSDELHFQVRNKEEDILYIKLKRVDHHLANIHTPVWSVRKKSNGPKFEKDNKAMNEMGEFSVYHDYITKSAVVYFHKTKQLDGVIDTRYYIRGLPIDKLNQIHNVNDMYIFDRSDSIEDYKSIFDGITPGMIGITGRRSRDTTGDKKISTASQSQSSIVYYCEILVVISYDVFKSLKTKITESQDIREEFKQQFNSVNVLDSISHVLTFYTAVDMVYNLMQTYTIKLNIAAIVVEMDEGALDFVESPLSIRTPVKDALLGDSLLINLMKGMEKLEHIFPQDSYDLLIYSTTQKLTTASPGRNTITKYYRGLTKSNLKKHKYQIDNFKHTSIIIRDDAQFDYFVTTAHEIGHAMGADHDPAKHDNNGGCDSHIMSPGVARCPQCLKWSDKTQIAFNEYFRSRAHCILRNFPRSLLPVGPRLMLTIDEQCQCYGYPPLQSQLNHYNVALEFVPNCNGPIQCQNKNSLVSESKPMDGTPCGEKKVCWNKKCLDSIN